MTTRRSLYGRSLCTSQSSSHSTTSSRQEVRDGLRRRLLRVWLQHSRGGQSGYGLGEGHLQRPIELIPLDRILSTCSRHGYKVMGVTIRELFNDHLRMRFVCYLKSYLLEMALVMTLPALLLSARTVQIAKLFTSNAKPPSSTHRKSCLSSPIEACLNLMTLNHPSPVNPSGARFKPAPASKISTTSKRQLGDISPPGRLELPISRLSASNSRTL